MALDVSLGCNFMTSLLLFGCVSIASRVCMVEVEILHLVLLSQEKEIHEMGVTDDWVNIRP